MLRAGPNGVQRIEPSAARRAPGAATAPPKASLKVPSAGRAIVVTGQTGAHGAPGVLSFKTLMGNAGAPRGGAAPKARAPQTPAPRSGLGARLKEEVKQEEEEWGEEEQEEYEGAVEPEEPLEGEQDEVFDWGPTEKVAATSALVPKAKRKLASQSKRPLQEPKIEPEDEREEERREVKEEAVKEESTDDILENDDWVKQFDKKWKEAMGETEEVKGAEVWEDDGEPPAKRPRAHAEQEKGQLPPKRSAPGVPTAKGAAPSKARLSPRQPQGPPPEHLMPKVQAPFTPAGVAKPAPGPDLSAGASEVALREEQPEWAARCTIEAAKPGQPQRLAISMAEVGLGDDGLAEWCRWMERRLVAARPGSGAPSGGRTRFRAGTVDLSENGLSASGVKALCALLEKHGVKSEVLRLTGNDIGNEGLRHLVKFLASSSQAPALELHLSRNKVTTEGVKWLLGCLAMHAAYPWWNNETERFVPLWLRLENNKFKAAAGYAALQAACASLVLSVCTGEVSGDEKCGPRQCVHVNCSDDLKHNCVAHLTGWTAPEGAAALPAPAPHPRSFFAPPGRAAPRPPPSGVEEPVRDEPRVVYEDSDLAVILKPAGWSCLPQPRGVDPSWARLRPLARRKEVGELMMQNSSAPPLQAWLLLHFGADPTCDASRDQASDRGLAHRLDLDTSGPILIGKTLKGYEHARKQVLAGLLKDFVTLVHGTPSTERGECCAPIDASAYAEQKRVRIDAAGQPATTVWEVIAEYESPERRDERYTLVHCRVGTLRTHHIRVHMQHVGHPIVGDRLYGSSDPPAFCPRLFLHKCRVGFFNLQGQACIESCSLQSAPDLWSALGRLRKVGGMGAKG
eukprot:CAMPEP_0179047228 /NCGR_PEP_ID=MMETSP0796-20121207/19090_1 /TAXON_ID=73915 /ORGANISM="Pyrodinium bahamense, Strain pbaha01" /LENGTH=851 /DNA_ID=CAMNT_0020743669 /DNA_START=38 /DNA_END=2590 /DNA_ORIENTATION=+